MWEGGAVVLWVGATAETDRVATTAARVGGALTDSQDGFLVIRKIGPTPPGFPRRPGCPKANPTGSSDWLGRWKEISRGLEKFPASVPRSYLERSPVTGWSPRAVTGRTSDRSAWNLCLRRLTLAGLCAERLIVAICPFWARRLSSPGGPDGGRRMLSPTLERLNRRTGRVEA